MAKKLVNMVELKDMSKMTDAELREYCKTIWATLVSPPLPDANEVGIQVSTEHEVRLELEAVEARLEVIADRED